MDAKPVRCAVAFLDKLLDFMQDTVKHDTRQQELLAWQKRLEPSCSTCAEWPVRDCPGSCRTPTELSACAIFKEKPEIASEREIVNASLEAIESRVH
jgi:hypothetical protein